jgi:ATP/maltotriose-dependent transcriptional regulator MalT
VYLLARMDGNHGAGIGGRVESVSSPVLPPMSALRAAPAARADCRLEMWTGRYAPAAANATEGLRLAVETGQVNPAAHHQSVLAWIAAVQGREQDCRDAAGAALARGIAHRLGPQAAIASLALAMLDVLERALALHAGSGRPFDAARTELLFGESLRRRRRRSRARTHLRAACEGFERLGALPWAEQARVELRATGETARRRDPGKISQLTPQELQIVRLVGDGGTNREIAAQLFLSPRTVTTTCTRCSRSWPCPPAPNLCG